MIEEKKARPYAFKEDEPRQLCDQAEYKKELKKSHSLDGLAAQLKNIINQGRSDRRDMKKHK
ncbi:MAG: hypothetical protein HWE34_13570 [Methylocystaceae bacterium]|nr:hypothetical protein [Methylocystaceae bacterium]